MSISHWILGCALVAGAGAVEAQTPVFAPPLNVLQLSASGSVEVRQDLLRMRLQTTRDGTDAAGVEAELKTALDTALVEARKSAESGQLDVQTGNFRMSPRTTREGKIDGWRGSAELLIEGRDFPRIARTAGHISTLTVSGVSFDLSREERAKAEVDAQRMAIDEFKQKAAALAAAFGFSAYTLREVSVNANGGDFPRPRAMAMRAQSALASDAPVPVEAGNATVVVNVSGSVQLK